MCLIKLVIRACFFLLLSAAAQDGNKQDAPNFIKINRPTINPKELVIRSSDIEGSLDCNAKFGWKNSPYELATELELFPRENSNNTTVKSTKEQINSMTVRHRIFPNGHIGAGRVFCHWNGYKDYGTRVNLYIGEDPGPVQLKKQCRAYDRRYVECVFDAPIIARGFRNGFPKLYSFTPLDLRDSASWKKIELINITNENELVFHFIPRDQNIFPNSTLMQLNATLLYFNSSLYNFSLETIHTTEVNFQLNTVSPEQVDIHINHNSSGTTDPRLCSGNITQVVNQATFSASLDINETSDQAISIRQLRPSSLYRVCLRCYYERTDESFNEGKCESIKTAERFAWWYFLSIATAVVLSLLALMVITLFIFLTEQKKCITSVIEIRSQRCRIYRPVSPGNPEPIPVFPPCRRIPSVTSIHSSRHTPSATAPGSVEELSSVDDDEYKPVGLSIRDIIRRNHPSPVAFDLSQDPHL